MNSPHLARTFISRFLPSSGNRANISSRGSKRRCVCVEETSGVRTMWLQSLDGWINRRGVEDEGRKAGRKAEKLEGEADIGTSRSAKRLEIEEKRAGFWNLVGRTQVLIRGWTRPLSRCSIPLFPFIKDKRAGHEK